METIESLNCAVIFWQDDAKIYRIETNLYSDVVGLVGEILLKNYNNYTKATIEWNGKLITLTPTAEYTISLL